MQATSVMLGAGNHLVNDGTLSPGGRSSIQATSIDGSFRQESTGVWEVDVMEGVEDATADSLNLTEFAQIDGAVDVNTIGDLSAAGNVKIASAQHIMGGAQVDSDDHRYDFSLDTLGLGSELWLSWIQSRINPVGMTWIAGDRIDVSAREDDNTSFTNAGILSVQSDGVIGETTVKGDPNQFTFKQKGTGVLAIDIDHDAGTSDRLMIEGNAEVEGKVKPQLTSLPSADADAQRYRFFTTTGRTVNNGLSLLSSVALDTDLASDEEGADLIVNGIDFTADGRARLKTNQGAIAENIQDSYVASGASVDTAKNGLRKLQLGLLNTVGASAYKAALDHLSPEIYLDTQIAALYSGLAFSDSLLSCRVNARDTASINREGQCVWANARWQDLDSQGTSQNNGYDEDAWQFTAGAQFALDPVWRLGFGVGYQTGSLNDDVGAESDGNQVQGGVVLKYNPGALLVAGMLSGGRGWYDTTRNIAFADFSETAQSSHDVDILSGRLHAGYVMGAPRFYYKPLIDGAVTRVRLGNVTEAGAGSADLRVHGSAHTVFSLSPALEVGTTWWGVNGTLVRPYARAGVTWFSDNGFSAQSSFVGGANGEAFIIRAGMDDVQVDLAAGVEMISSADQSVRLFYEGNFGDQITVHGAGVKGSLRF